MKTMKHNNVFLILSFLCAIAGLTSLHGTSVPVQAEQAGQASTLKASWEIIKAGGWKNVPAALLAVVTAFYAHDLGHKAAALCGISDKEDRHIALQLLHCASGAGSNALCAGVSYKFLRPNDASFLNLYLLHNTVLNVLMGCFLGCSCDLKLAHAALEISRRQQHQ